MIVKRLTMTLILVTAAALSGAQEDPPRVVDNPYQEEVVYVLGDDLAPDVAVEGVWWSLMRVTPNTGESPKRGEHTPIVADLRFDNRSERSARLSVVVMLEDWEGNQLERLKFPGFKLASNRVKEFQAKFTVPGEDLLATRRVYLFCQVD